MDSTNLDKIFMIIGSELLNRPDGKIQGTMESLASFSGGPLNQKISIEIRVKEEAHRRVWNFGPGLMSNSRKTTKCYAISPHCKHKIPPCAPHIKVLV